MFKLRNITIQNFKSVKGDCVKIGENKTVFVGKNGTGKSNILKAIEKICNPRNHPIKITDFFNPDKEIKIEITVEYKNEFKKVWLISKIFNHKVKTSYYGEIDLLDKIDLVYISADRKFNKNDPENGFYKMINLILTNKEDGLIKGHKKQFKTIQKIQNGSSNDKTTLFITLLELYLLTLNKTENKRFHLFVIDQPENFLHPHGTKLIDRLLHQIAELQNTQILYSTHSPELVSNFRKGFYELGDVIFVKKQDAKTHTHRIQNHYGKYNKIMISLIFKNSSIFFSDGVILVEGETERISLPNIFENWNWGEKVDSDSINLESNNINVIDVGGKGALSEWYCFASEVFGKNKVFAIIDRDPTFDQDKEMIQRAIKKVHKRTIKNEDKFIHYNWLVLGGEFEAYYKIDKIREYIKNTIKIRAQKKFGEDFNENKLQDSYDILNYRLQKIIDKPKKISKEYAKLFNKYYHRYGKPTIAFNLSIWLSECNGFKKELVDHLSLIVKKIEK